MELAGKKILLTGGNGFLGKRIKEKLKDSTVITPRKKDYDFVSFDQTMACMDDVNPDIVIHSAALYGGIWINKVKPGTIYFQNTVMGANIFEASRLAGVQKLVSIGTACSYPGVVEGKLKESELWNGPCHESVENYGAVKKMMLLQGRSYKREFDFNSIHLILTNLYGPGDTFNPERSHVVSALIRKFVEAKNDDKSEVLCWGTGKPVREFLYVDDCAEGIVEATKLYDDAFIPINIGTGIGTSIKELSELVKEKSDFPGIIKWDPSKPDGAMEKVLDVSLMKQKLNWQPKTPLALGLEKTIDWYVANKKDADARY